MAKTVDVVTTGTFGAMCSSGAWLNYTGKLFPEFGNATYSGAGELSPLINDRSFRTLGIGTRLFLGGAQGYTVGSGTQHRPENEFGTLMVQGDLKKMSLTSESLPETGRS